MRRKNSIFSRGLAAVEMALILPAVLMMIFGLVEAGNLLLSWLTVQKAAEVGARFAATGQGEDEGTRLVQILERTNAVLASLGNAGATVNVRSWPGLSTSGAATANNAGQPCGIVEVSVAYPYQPFTPLVGDLLPDTVLVSGADRKVNEPWKPCP